jgi:hypothetical protein
MIIIVQQRQSVMDIALQYFGSPEAAFLVAERIGCSITDELEAGTEITVFDNEIMDSNIVDHYRKNKIVPTTALTVPIETGVDFMEIENDLIVK